jgi:hypothetical protein
MTVSRQIQWYHKQLKPARNVIITAMPQSPKTMQKTVSRYTRRKLAACSLPPFPPSSVLCRSILPSSSDHGIIYALYFVAVSLPKPKNPSHQRTDLAGTGWRLVPVLLLCGGDVAVRCSVVCSRKTQVPRHASLSLGRESRRGWEWGVWWW